MPTLRFKHRPPTGRDGVKTGGPPPGPERTSGHYHVSVRPEGACGDHRPGPEDSQAHHQGAAVCEMGVVVGQQVPGDGEDGVADRDGGACLAAAAGEPVVAEWRKVLARAAPMDAWRGGLGHPRSVPPAEGRSHLSKSPAGPRRPRRCPRKGCAVRVRPGGAGAAGGSWCRAWGTPCAGWYSAVRGAEAAAVGSSTASGGHTPRCPHASSRPSIGARLLARGKPPSLRPWLKALLTGHFACRLAGDGSRRTVVFWPARALRYWRQGKPRPC